MERLDLSLIIPAYNEEKRLPFYLKEVFIYLGASGLKYEVIVVDDGSQDKTSEIITDLMKKHPELDLITLPQNMGKGCAVRAGMLHARGSLRLFADSDGATPINELGRLMLALKGGADIAIGSRALVDRDTVVSYKIHRKILGTIFNLIVRLFAVREIRDTQCGFKLFSEKAALNIFLVQRIDGFGFDVEILFIAQKLGYRIAEVPVNWTDIGESKVKILRDPFRMLSDVFRIRINYLLGFYNRKSGAISI